MKFYHYIFIFLLAASSLAKAQLPLPEGAKVKAVHMECSTDAQGATLGAVRCFLQDQEGYMWIGSENGLFRYDGFHLTPYYKLSVQDGPQEMGFVSALVTDSSGYLFANLHAASVLRIHIPTFTITNYPLPKAQAGIADIHHLAVYQGLVWGATENGLFQLDPKTGAFTFYQPTEQDDFPLKADVLYSVYPDPDQPHRMWVGSISGLLSFDLNTRKFRPHFIKFEHPRQRSEQLWGCLAEYEPGKLWCSGYASGMRIFDQATGQWQSLLKNPFQQDVFFMQRLGKSIYGVHYDYGAGLLNPTTQQLDFFRDPGYRTVGYEQHKYHALYMDKEQQLWVGSDAGFCYFQPEVQPIHHVFLPKRDNESEFFFTACAEDMGDYYLLATAYGYGLYKWYKADGRIEIIPHNIFQETDTRLDIYASLKRPDGSVDLFTRKGMWRYIPGQEKVIPINLNLVAIRAKQWRVLYVVQTDWKTLKYVRQGRVVRTLKFNGEEWPALDRITSFTIAEGYLWAIGNSTLLRIALADGELQLWQNTEAETLFPYRHLRGLEVVGQKIIIGNRSAGFELFECRGDSLIKLNTFYEDLLGRRPQVFSAARRGQKVYLCTSQGLTVYDVATDAVTNINKSDGLLVQNLGKTWISEVTPMEDGRVMVSGHGFFTLIEEDALEAPPPVLQIGQILQNGKPLPAQSGNDGLQLAHDENAFEVHYNVQPMRLGPKLSYRHRLAGFDEGWVESQGGEVRYTSLPPGPYRLDIQATADYQWREAASVSLPVRVVPPFYQTYGFYALCTVALLGFAAYLYRKRISYIKQEEALKSEFNRKVAQLEMEALRAQMNPHFIFNALNSIEYYINEENTTDAVNYLQKFAALIRMTLQNSKQPYISLQEELASLRYYIEIEQMRLDNSFDYQIEVAEGLSTAQILIPPLLLQPYVENAIWHGLLYQDNRRGHLQIQCRQDAARTEIRITDNGIGRQKSAELRRHRLKNKKSMGMIITKRRMELNQTITGIQTEVEVEDRFDAQGKSNGTSVIIHLQQKPIAS